MASFPNSSHGRRGERAGHDRASRSATLAACCVVASMAVAVVAWQGAARDPPRAAAFPGFTAEESSGGSGGERQLVVTSVQTAGPAQRAGLMAGDRIAAIDARPVHGRHDAEAMAAGAARGGHHLVLRTLHNHESHVIVVSTNDADSPRTSMAIEDR